MSKIGVSLKINVSMIDKQRLFAGKKGTYLDATVFIDLDELDQFDNSGMITQDVSKEEKASGGKGAILGNCKVFWSDSGNAPQKPAAHNQQQQYQPPQQQAGFNQQAPQQPAGGFDDFDDDIPFN